MDSVAKETLVPALGIAGLFALGYHTYKNWNSSTNSNLHPTPTTQHSITEIENRFFRALSYRLEVTDNQFKRLKSNVSKLALRNRQEIMDAADMYVILCVLRDIGYLSPKYYSSHACNILCSADINCDDHITRSLDLLEKVINDVLDADAELQEHEHDFQYDVVIAHASEDREKADDFLQNMKSNLQVPNLKIAILDEIEGEILSSKSLKNILKISVYVFVLMTENMTDEEMDECLGDCSILQGHDTRWRLVPLWMKKDTNIYKKCPLDISVMKGINYWRYAETPENETEKQTCLKLICKNILHGRELLKFDCTDQE